MMTTPGGGSRRGWRVCKEAALTGGFYGVALIWVVGDGLILPTAQQIKYLLTLWCLAFDSLWITHTRICAQSYSHLTHVPGI